MSRSAADRIRAACITVLGSGYAPIAPGSCGSLAALLIFAFCYGAARAAGLPGYCIDAALTVPGVLVASGLSVLWGAWALQRYNSPDPKPFVLDEFAGQWLALLWLPPAAATGLWGFACVSAGQSVLFRIFDVLKPPPGRALERLPAGWGVLCDDLLAGLYANVVGQLLWRRTPLPVWLGLE